MAVPTVRHSDLVLAQLRRGNGSPAEILLGTLCLPGNSLPLGRVGWHTMWDVQSSKANLHDAQAARKPATWSLQPGRCLARRELFSLLRHAHYYATLLLSSGDALQQFYGTALGLL